jgi:predicted unusual protein kinase regulating ubiquinone biosynthesis (AarF/ABC1/UbiB family)
MAASNNHSQPNSGDTSSKTLRPRKAMEKVKRSINIGFNSGWRLNSTVFKASPKLIKCLREKRKPTAIEVRELFESLGVTYIKLGQFIASSPSIFPADYVAAFQNCFDNTPAISYKIIKRTIEKELGCPIEEIYSHIDQSPLASASIAQVHSATLHNGDEVVIKVQKPGVELLIDTDLSAAFIISKIIELVSPALDSNAVTDIITEIHRSMRDECDFIKEANNLEAFNTFLIEQNITTVIAPKIYPHACSKRVLTMQRIYGKAFTDTTNASAATQPLTADKQAAAQIALFNALNVWFLSIRQCDFFHADLHSGNLLLTDNAQVAFIDFGMVGRITDTIWSAAVQLFESFNDENYGQMAAAMMEVGMTKQKIDQQQLAKDLQWIFDNSASASASLSSIDSSKAEDKSQTNPLQLISQIAKRHGIRFPSAFTLLLKQFLNFDRYLHLLAPETGLFDHQIMQTFEQF